MSDKTLVIDYVSNWQAKTFTIRVWEREGRKLTRRKYRTHPLSEVEFCQYYLHGNDWQKFLETEKGRYTQIFP